MKASWNIWVRTALFGAVALGLGVAPATAGKVDFGSGPTLNKGHAMNPVWSLDGKYLAFEVNTFGGDGIAMYFSEVKGSDAQASQAVKLPGATGPYAKGQVVMNATWHPQGIAVFEGSNSGGDFRLYFAQPGGAMAAEMLPNNAAPGQLQFPAVAPNGDLLAYTSSQYGKGDVMTWSRSTNNIERMTSSESVSEAFPSFSKDGTKMLFVRKGQTASIHEVDVASKSERQISPTTAQGDQTRPIYAGDRIFYFASGKKEGEWDLASSRGDGSDRKIHAAGVRLPERARPAVSPDGKYVAYVSGTSGQDTSIQIMDIASGTVKPIKTKYTACGEPAIGINAAGQYLLAYTALPSSDSDWRFLYVVNVSNDI